MREIKFRAKISGTDEWIYGLPNAVYLNNNIDSIQCKKSKKIEYIKIDTLGEYTGLKDKNGKEIYEGDILTYHYYDFMCIVKFENGSFVCYHAREKDWDENELKWGLLSRAFDSDMIESFGEIEIIGNIYENPELFK